MGCLGIGANVTLSPVPRQGIFDSPHLSGMMPRGMEDGLKLAIERAGSVRKLARMLGISMQAVVKWKTVPAHQIIPVERATGVPREELRPDLYRRN